MPSYGASTPHSTALNRSIRRARPTVTRLTNTVLTLKDRAAAPPAPLEKALPHAIELLRAYQKAVTLRDANRRRSTNEGNDTIRRARTALDRQVQLARKHMPWLTIAKNKTQSRSAADLKTAIRWLASMKPRPSPPPTSEPGITCTSSLECPSGARLNFCINQASVQRGRIECYYEVAGRKTACDDCAASQALAACARTAMASCVSPSDPMLDRNPRQ